jgi:hypothetical protein
MTFLTTASTKIEVAAASMAELVAFYNDRTGKSIKKFETRAKGVERVTALLKAVDDIAPPPYDGPSALGQIAKSVVKPTPKKPAAKKAPAQAKKPTVAAKPGRGRALFSEDGVITVKHKGDNPKRGTAADRYDLYRTGMTVSAYIAAGGQRRDVVWDQHQGWITVKG